MKFVKNLVFAGLAAVALLACTADPEPKAVIYTIGDSTVKNGQGRGDGGLWGWGDPFAYFFDSTQVDVVNVARGGTSSRTYRTLGLWQPTLEVKAGDLFLFNLGTTMPVLLMIPPVPGVPFADRRRVRAHRQHSDR